MRRTCFTNCCTLISGCLLAAQSVCYAQDSNRHLKRNRWDRYSVMQDSLRPRNRLMPDPLKDLRGLSLAGKSPDAISQQAYRMSHSALRDADQAIQQQQALLERTRANIDSKLQHDISLIPKFVYFGQHKIDNRDYQAQISSLRKAAENEHSQALLRYENSVKIIAGEVKRKLEGLGFTANHLNQQTKSTRGNVGLVPAGSSMYVRNYVVFPDSSESDFYRSPEVPLKASPAKKLVPKQTPKGK